MHAPARAALLVLPLWLAGACVGTPKGEPDALVAEARGRFEKGSYGEARRYAKAVVKGHEESDAAEEAKFLLAESQRKLGNGQRSFEAYQTFVKEHPNSRFSVAAALGEYDLGTAYLDGKMTGFLFFGADRGYGVRVLDHMQTNFRNHSLADDALVRVAEYQISDEEFAEAADTLRRLLAEYPRSEHVLWGRFQYARALWLQNQGPLYDERLLLQSRRGFEDFVGTVRLAGAAEQQQDRIRVAEEMIVKINERLAEKEYEIGRFYERTKAPRAAAYYYRHCLRTYPGSRVAADCQARLKEVEAVSSPAPPAPAGPGATG